MEGALIFGNDSQLVDTETKSELILYLIFNVLDRLNADVF